ncbi:MULTISPECIES: hypothetical protein [unclassified Acinetobacter]|uniref:hypothetical protein n=1 Tax=unclassified Acinetobacter TaxID=196816 RepID=UPI001FD6CC73|nr:MULTISPECIES: hypothetical protein [unclassified Acinetobacter]
MKPLIFTLVLLSSATLLTACDNIKKVLPQAENEQSVKVQAEMAIQNKSPLQGIETLVDNKVTESIKFLNEESRRSASDDDYYKYALNSKNIIKSDLNQDGKIDYVVEASFCEETNCHSTTMTYEVFIFTTNQQDQINFITDLNLGLDAKVTNISKDGIITIENHEYAEDDPSCCPSIINTQSYALVGKKLALLANP